MTVLPLPEDLRDRLATAAQRQGIMLPALVERYAQDGTATDAHLGIVFKSDPSGRRAALADQFGIHRRQVTIEMDHAAEQPDEIETRMEANEAALVAARRAHEARQRLLDGA